MNKKYTVLNGTVFLVDGDGNILSKGGTLLEGAVFVTDEKGVRTIKNSEDIDTKLKLENLNERLQSNVLAHYTISINNKLSDLSDLRKKYGEAKSYCYKFRLFFGFLVFLGFLGLGLFTSGTALYNIDMIDDWRNVIEALRIAPREFLTISSFCVVPGTAYLTYILSSFFINKRKAARLEVKIQSLESEIKELEREKEEIQENSKVKETENVGLQGETHYLDMFNHEFEERIMARLRKIQELEELKRTLQEILQGREFEELLLNGGFKQEEIVQVRETLGKRFLMQPLDKSTSESQQI